MISKEKSEKNPMLIEYNQPYFSIYKVLNNQAITNNAPILVDVLSQRIFDKIDKKDQGIPTITKEQIKKIVSECVTDLDGDGHMEINSDTLFNHLLKFQNIGEKNFGNDGHIQDAAELEKLLSELHIAKAFDYDMVPNAYNYLQESSARLSQLVGSDISVESLMKNINDVTFSVLIDYANKPNMNIDLIKLLIQNEESI